MSLRTTNVSLSYFDGDQTTYAVRDISIEVGARGFFGIMGPSGSGKSSLLYLMSGLKQPTTGDVVYAAKSLVAMSEKDRAGIRRKQFGFVFQQPFLLNYLTARENVAIAAPEGDRSTAERVDTLLAELNIHHLRDRYPSHLSGGERQRLVVARAMINNPAVIFADEPTAALDQTNGHAVIELLMRYRERGAVVVVTHDPAMVDAADRLYHLRDGLLDRIEDRLIPSPI